MTGRRPRRGWKTLIGSRGQTCQCFPSQTRECMPGRPSARHTQDQNRHPPKEQAREEETPARPQIYRRKARMTGGRHQWRRKPPLGLVGGGVGGSGGGIGQGVCWKIFPQAKRHTQALGAGYPDVSSWRDAQRERKPERQLEALEAGYRSVSIMKQMRRAEIHGAAGFCALQTSRQMITQK